MNRGNGTKKSITPQQRGTCLNIVFDLVNVKYKTKYADDMFCKQRSDNANALGDINSKNRGIL